ncbi:PQQ-dependent dehydrogenase, methanol/ethanol family [Azohydromonas australica]|uniref:PQQ-dependent dehydrogenase, methanol/ethanol family n=1 Tax=Azohydromonas australica TaxID=364039 RepID=UPI0004175F56|nr:PQQ-dependent dehydrogenase, methanol/ethanol family [Azohydromonas australica]
MKFISHLPVAACAALLLATTAHAQSDEDLKRDGGGANVLTYGMGYGQQRYSTLDQINKRNVGKLKAAWSLSLENDFGEQAQPIVQDGVMYVSNPKWTVAIDAVTGKQLWRTASEFDADTARVVCCGVSNRGVALYKDMVLRGTLDAHLEALDKKTGKRIWKTKVVDWKEGYSITGAPVVANGVLITGISGGEFGVRGFLAGFDPATGKELWRRHTTAAPEEKGGETWGVEGAYKTGGASTWITGSYDPDLDLVYWGTGNAAPWNPKQRGGDSLFTCSVIAVRPTTGELVWHYQFTPAELYDYDAVGEMILGDLPIDGKKHKVVMQLNKNGFAYVLDRANGKLLAANPFGRVNWASKIDLQTGRPVESEVTKAVLAGESPKVWPSAIGVKPWAHAAFDPNKRVLYANTVNMWMTYNIGGVTGEHKPGQRWTGYRDLSMEKEPGEPWGYMEAIDPLSGKPKWRVPLEDQTHWSSMMATAGGLVFTGRETGEFIALDADTGKQLWQFTTSSGINANPVTWSYKGKQYVTVLSGIGGVGARRNGDVVKNVPKGGSVWTFALQD